MKFGRVLARSISTITILLFATANHIGVASGFGERGLIATRSLTPDLSVTDKELVFRRKNLHDVTHRPCGTKKCLFLLKSDLRLGYVATYRRYDSSFAFMQLSWKLAEKIEEYGMEHVFMAPPELVSPPSERFRSWLGQNMTWYNSPHPTNEDFYLATNLPYIPIQLTRVIGKQEGWLVFLNNNRYGESVNITRKFLQDDIVSQPDHIRETFLTQFQLEVSRFVKVLDAHPCLYADLQFFLTRQGCIVHFDLDRCFECVEKSCENVREKERPNKVRWTKLHAWADLVIDQVQIETSQVT